MRSFLRNLVGTLAFKFIASLLLAFLAIAGLGPERLVRILNGWWTNDPSSFALNLTRAISVIVSFAILAILVWPRIKARYFPDPAQYVDKIHIAAGMTPQTTVPVLLLSTAKTSNSRLRIVLEYSHFYTALGSAGWTAFRQITLADLKDVIAGQQINSHIATCKLDGSEMWWGGENDSSGNLIQKSIKYRAKIRFIVSGNDEQIFRFGLLRTSPNEKPYLAVVFTENDLEMKDH
jgi:hypothetical protein